MVRLEPLQRALLKRDPNEVRSALEEDSTAATLPLRCRGGALEPPLVAAVRSRCLSPTLKILLHYGADVNDAGPRGDTPLMAVATTQPRQHDIDVEGMSLRVKLPQYVSMPELLDEKVQSGAKSAALFAGELPKPCANDTSCSLALCLLQAKADPGVSNVKGQTAAQMAKEQQRPQLAFLIDNWRNWEARRYLHALWSRQDDASGYAPNLAQCPADVHGLLCSMIAP